MKPASYSSRHVLISLGYHAVRDLADGTFVSIEPHGEGFEKIVGADGSVAVGIDPDWTATVTLTVMQTAQTAHWCQERYMQAQRTGQIEYFPVMIHDLTGRLMFHAEHAWISQMPTREFGKGAPDSEVEIVIETGDATWEVV